ncbi:MAG: ATP-binding protein [Phycisphaerae bacterium]|nr:ATP-binding protein [Phycisphaerae bacterium]
MQRPTDPLPDPVPNEHRPIEAQLQQSQRLESLSVLAGGIAHDFNNLLTIIGGNAQFLRETATLDATQAKALADIETATRSAIDMIRALLAFSRPSKPQISVCDANKLTQDIYRFLRRLIPARIDFRFHPHTSPCCIAADTGQIQQVLINLCINARDACQDQGHIELQTRIVPASALPASNCHQAHQPDYVEIAVRDDGLGMDEQTLGQVFDPFFTTKTQNPGAGLGLSIAYRIVQAHHGMIDAISVPQKGSEFKVFLPHVQAPTQGSESQDAPVTGTEHILVLDDEPMIASLIGTILQTRGYQVTIVHHPDQAIEAVSSSDVPFDLAVVDYDLPSMIGPDCIAVLRKQRPNLKCVMISGHHVGLPKLDMKNDRLLTKPFTSQAIAQVIREALDNRDY